MSATVPTTARRLAAGIAAGLALCVMAGCGEDVPPPQVVHVDTSPPRPVVPLSATVTGFVRALQTQSCGDLADLVHSVNPPLDAQGCADTRRRLDGFHTPVAKSYGTGAVIDFRTTGGAHRTIVMALDANRRYRMLFIVNVSHGTVDTAPAPAFDAAARAVTRALALGDCSQFVALTDREIGIGTSSANEICQRLPLLGVAQNLGEHPRTQPLPLGGNRYFAFYGLRTGPHDYHTLVMARQPLEHPRISGGFSLRFVTAAPA